MLLERRSQGYEEERGEHNKKAGDDGGRGQRSDASVSIVVLLSLAAQRLLLGIFSRPIASQVLGLNHGFE